MDVSAELSAEELEAAKRYIRPSVEEDDWMVAQCVIGARSYLVGAGIRLPEAGTARRAQYDLVAHALALSAYDQREPTITGGTVAANPVLRRSLKQLQLSEPPMSNLDTGDGEGGRCG